VFMNDAELRMLTGESNLVRAAREVIGMGPRVVVAKQGEFVVTRGPNVVLEVIDASAMAARDPASSEAVAGHGAVHVELRPAAAKRLAALLLAHMRASASG
jgi:hypothetical protein